MSQPLVKRMVRACGALLLPVVVIAADFQQGDSPVPIDEMGFGANSDEFHVIAIPQEDHLKLLVERFGEARAITQAAIEIHSADKQVQATEVGDGVYRAAEGWLLEPGKKALAVTVSAEGIRDVLVMVFDPEQAVSGAGPRESKYGPRKSVEQRQ